MKNPLRNTGLLALTTPEEQSEIRLVMGRVKLQRTFTQKTLSGPPIKFWRVVGPSTHPNYMSDLSLDGLKRWEII